MDTFILDTFKIWSPFVLGGLLCLPHLLICAKKIETEPETTESPKTSTNGVKKRSRKLKTRSHSESKSGSKPEEGLEVKDDFKVLGEIMRGFEKGKEERKRREEEKEKIWFPFILGVLLYLPLLLICAKKKVSKAPKKRIGYKRPKSPPPTKSKLEMMKQREEDRKRCHEEWIRKCKEEELKELEEAKEGFADE